MSATTLAAAALLSLAVGLFYAYVGKTVLNRAPDGRHKLELFLFAAWWLCLGSYMLVQALQLALAATGRLDAEVARTVLVLGLLLLCGGLGCLLHYLQYLYTGSRRPLPFLAAGYFVLYGVLVHLVVRSDAALAVGRWSVRLEAGEAAILGRIVVLAILVPILGAAAAYGTLALRVRDRERRFRIGVVSLSILVWFGSTLAANLGPYAGTDAWQVVSRLIGLAAAAAVLVAYRPPAPLQRWLAATPGGAA